MINVVFFDFDGVLTTDKNGWYTTCKYISQRTKIDEEKVIQCYIRHSEKLNEGKITHEDIWDEFCSCLGATIDSAILQEAFAVTPKNDDMFLLAKKLSKKYKIGIITDNKKDRWDVVVQKFKMDKIFDSMILSADVGAGKRSRIIFDAALASVHATPEECVFIDNTKGNLDVPKEMGFTTLYYDHEKNDVSLLISQLQDAGLDV